MCGVCFLIFHTVRDGINRLTAIEAVVSGMHVVLCETEGGKKILFACCCQVELHRDLSVWLRMYVCILEKLLWGVVYLLCMAKSFCWLRGKSMACLFLCLPLQCPEAGPIFHMVALLLNPRCPWHLLLFSPDCLLSSTCLFSTTIYHVLLCFSLFSLLCWQRLNVTPSAMACCCVRLYEMKCFISAAPGMDFGLAWLGCTDPNDRPALAY